MKFTLETPQDPETSALIDASLAAREHSHSPYSKFRVGAAIRTTDGQIFRGCNIESCSFSPTICAERVAVSTAVASGHKNFDTIAISSDEYSPPTSPCGVCRQFMREFRKELVILLVRPDRQFCRTSLEELLPASFGPDSLNKLD